MFHFVLFLNIPHIAYHVFNLYITLQEFIWYSIFWFCFVFPIPNSFLMYCILKFFLSFEYCDFLQFLFLTIEKRKTTKISCETLRYSVRHDKCQHNFSMQIAFCAEVWAIDIRPPATPPHHLPTTPDEMKIFGFEEPICQGCSY